MKPYLPGQVLEQLLFLGSLPSSPTSIPQARPQASLTSFAFSPFWDSAAQLMAVHLAKQWKALAEKRAAVTEVGESAHP